MATKTMPTVMATLMRRLPNSTHAWYWSGATTLVEVHVGQSLQPRPEPVSLTAPPLTMPTARAATARAALRRRKRGAAGRAHNRGRWPAARRSAHHRC